MRSNFRTSISWGGAERIVLLKGKGGHHHTLGDLFDSLHRYGSDAGVSETLVQVPLGAF